MVSASVFVFLGLCMQVVGIERILRREKRIVNGELSDISGAKYMAALRGRHRNKGPWAPSYNVCGGTLISERYILTAAHCSDFGGYMQAANWRIKLGSNKIKDETKWFKKEEAEYRISGIAPHRDYNGNDVDLKNDISIMRLSENIDLSRTDNVEIVELANEGDTVIDTECKVYGWGLTDLNSANEAYPESMREGRMNLLSDEECLEYWVYDKEKQICATALKPYSIGVHLGDSGGPLICKTNDGGKWKQVGVLSHVSGDDAFVLKVPAVFTRVTGYRDWIKRRAGV